MAHQNKGLSYSQQRMWVMHQLDPRSTVNHYDSLWRLAGKWDSAILERCFQKILQRHEVLRATFSDVEGQPVQVIDPRVDFALKVVDFPEESDALDWVRREVHRPFDLSHSPLVRGALLRVKDGDALLLVTLHGLVSDRESMDVMVQELSQLYAGYLQDGDPTLPELPMQYGDVVLKQRELLKEDRLTKQLAYWEKQLADVPVLQLPTDRPRPAMQTFRGGAQSFHLSPSVVAELRQLGHEEGVPLDQVLLTAFKVLLYRYSRQEELAVGISSPGRDHKGTAGVIGPLANPLVIRTKLSEEPSFRELLGRVSQQVEDAVAHSDIPFEKLVEKLNPERDRSHSPLFQVYFALQKKQDSFPLSNGLGLESVQVAKETSLYDLSLLVKEEDRLSGELVYNTDLFEEETIQRMAEQLQVLLEGIAAQPDTKVGALPLLPAAERHQLLVEWNETAMEYPQGQCLHELFVEQAGRTPDAVAVEYLGEQVTYRQLDKQASQLAHYLQQKGLQKGDRVGIHLTRSIQMVVAKLAVMKAGGVYIPLDTSYPQSRLEYMARNAALSFLLHDEHSFMEEEELIKVNLRDEQEAIALCPTSIPSQSNPQDLAYIIYTSGSTGQPKGVAIRHQSLVSYLYAIMEGLGVTSADRVLQFAPMSFDATVEEVYPFLLCGGTVVVCPDELRVSSSEFTRYVEESQVNVLSLPTSFWHSWVDEMASSGDAVPEALRMVLLNAEQPSLSHYETWNDMGGKGVQVINTYGPTEATVTTTLFDMGELTPEHHKIPIGRPIHNAKIYVLDPYLQPVPLGVPGELYIGGEGVAPGYLNQEELNRECFLANPFIKGGRLYKTGDLVRYLPDGNLEFIGRLDHQVKIRGFRIELGEVEAVLASHPRVQGTVALVREDVPGDKRLVAYVVPTREGNLRIQDLREHVKERLPDFMVPAAIVLLDAFPLSPNGKVNRKALPAPDWGGLEEYVAPRTPVEEMLAGIWTEVLRVEKVGVHDHFFDLGGHSLLATQVLSRVRKSFQVEVPLSRFFETPTVAALAQEVEQRMGKGDPQVHAVIPRTLREEPLELSFAQQRLWFLYQLDPESPSYNMPTLWRIRGKLEAQVLERCCQEMIRRHEVLRTTFPSVEGEPVQVIHDHMDFSLDVAKFVTEEEALGWIRLEANRPFDLVEGPLFRCALIHLSEEEHLFLANMHHIVSDGWSMSVFAEELGELYEAYTQEKSSPLSKLPIQYGDFALWQREWFQGDVLEQQLGYWRKQLEGVPILQLPTDYPRPAVQTFRGKSRTFRFSPPVIAALRELSRQEGATLYMTLLSAFKVLLHRYTQQEDIPVGTPIANRNREEIEGLIGFFVNTLVLRTNLSEEPSFRELLKRVKEQALEAYTHQDLPFEKLVEELQPERDLSHSPLFQVFFALHNELGEPIPLGEGVLEPVHFQRGVSLFDLSLIIEEKGEEITGELEYNTDLFADETMERMAHNLEVLLEGIVADPDQKIGFLPILSPKERHQLLVEWNQTESEYEDKKTVPELIQDQVKKTPDAVALLFKDKQVSYRELNHQANQLAEKLRQKGVQAGSIVGIMVERSIEMVVGILGILKAGGTYLPIDPTYPEERIQYMLEDSHAALLLSQQDLSTPAGYTGSRINLDDPEVYTGDGSDLPFVHRDSDAAYVIYTSGSTGRPKGVVLPHRAVSNFVHGMTEAISFQAGDRIVALTTISFDIFLLETLYPLTRGMEVVIASEAEQVDPHAFRELVGKHPIDWLQTTPSRLKLLWSDPETVESLRAVGGVLVGGEPLPDSWLKELQKEAGRKIYNMYGPTETTVWSLVRDLTNLKRVDIGRPIANTELYLLDSNLNPVPIGVPAELHIGGDGLAQGYHNRPDLTAEVFIPHPFKEGERIYKTGDLVRYQGDGNLEFLGRIDHQVKIRGFRIELGEIEAVLTSHPHIQAAVVVVQVDSMGDDRLVAYGVPAKDEQLQILELQEYAKKKLPEYMVPTAWVEMDSLPLTPNGKVDRKALPAPDWAGESLKKEYVAPRTSTEEMLAEIWSEVLGMERIGVYDDFFALGGHSLKMTQVTSRVENRFHVRVPLQEIFENPTIEKLAAVITNLKEKKEAGAGDNDQLSSQSIEEMIDNLSDSTVMDMLEALLEEEEKLGKK